VTIKQYILLCKNQFWFGAWFLNRTTANTKHEQQIKCNISFDIVADNAQQI
jgi:hypothetical protein